MRIERAEPTVDKGRRKTGCRYELLALHIVGTTAGFPDLQPEPEPSLIYVPEKELVRYGQEAGFPEDTPCPQGLTSRRAQTKTLPCQFGRDQKQILANLRRTTRQAMGL